MIQNISGFEFFVDDASGVIKSIRSQSFYLSVGGRVMSNGRNHIQKDRVGTLVRIEYPYCAGRTTDILVIRWDGVIGFSWMKLKDVRSMEDK